MENNARARLVAKNVRFRFFDWEAEAGYTFLGTLDGEDLWVSPGGDFLRSFGPNEADHGSLGGWAPPGTPYGEACACLHHREGELMGGRIGNKRPSWLGPPKRKAKFRVLQTVRVGGDAAYGGAAQAQIRDLQPYGDCTRFTLRFLNGSREKLDVRVYCDTRQITWSPEVESEPTEVWVREKDGPGPRLVLWPSKG